MRDRQGVKGAARPRRRSRSWSALVGGGIILLGVINAIAWRPGTIGARMRNYSMPADSMRPTLLVGDFFLTQMGVDPRRDLKRGDVIIFLPEGKQSLYVKRLIGLPGESVQMINGVVHVNGEALPQRVLETMETPFDLHSSETIKARIVQETGPEGRSWRILDFVPLRSGADTPVIAASMDQFIVLGDNRDNSLDSRVSRRAGGLGPIAIDGVVGRAAFVSWSKEFGRIGRPVE